MKINWQDLEDSVFNTPECEELPSSCSLATRALEFLLGEEFLKGAVDQYMNDEPQAELAREILIELRSSVAMNYCYSIYKTEDLDRKVMALELLRWMSNERVIQWIPEFLDSPEADVQNWAVAIIDQMLFKQIIHYDSLESILENALKQTKREYIRERIQSFIDAESYFSEP